MSTDNDRKQTMGMPNRAVNKRVLGGVGAVLLGMSVVTMGSWAKPYDRDHHGDWDSDRSQHRLEKRLAHLDRHLDLTEQQHATIKGLLQTAFSESEGDRERMQQLRDQLHDLRDGFDDREARRTADEIGRLTSDRVYRMANTQAQVYQVLDTEQRAELDAMKEKRGERRRDHRRPEHRMF